MNAVLKPPKPKTCKACGSEFTPARMGQKVCFAFRCVTEYMAMQREAKQRKAERVAKLERKGRLLELKPRSYFVRVAQSAFNAWVRERDRMDGCISCHMPATYGGRWHASHYRSTGAAPELRFDPDNVNKSCAQCNEMKSGNVVEYRIGLIAKIGVERVERLEGPHEPKKYTVEQLQALTKDYRARTRELLKARGA